MKVSGSSQVQGAAAALNNVNKAAYKTNTAIQQQASFNYKSVKSWDALRDGLANAEQKLDAVYRAAFHLTDLGGRLLGVTEGLVGAAADLVMNYADYDLMLRRGAVALNTNAEWQEKLNKAIQQTAIDIGLFSPEEVAEAYYLWGAAAGVVVDTQEELDDITRTVSETMIATAMAGGTLEGNLKGIYGILSVFNLEMEQSSEVIQVLALMTERTAADFGDLTSAFTYVGPLAETLGVTFDEMAQLLGILADAGQRGSRAGRGLSMVLEGLSAPSGPAKEQLDKVAEAINGVGAEWEDLAFPQGEFAGWESIINDVAVATADWSDAERGMFYSKALTNNATRAFIPLIEDQIDLNRRAAESGAEWTSVLDQEKYSLEEAGEFFAIMSDQALGSIHSIVGAVQNSFFPVLELIAKAVLDMAAPFLETIKQGAVEVREWMDQNPEIVKMIVNIGAIIAIVAGVAGAIALAAGTLMMLGAGIAFVVTTLGGMIMSFGILGMIVGGVIAAILSNFGGLRTAVERLVRAIGGLFDSMDFSFDDIELGVATIVDNITPVLEPIAETIAGWIDFIATWINKLNEDETFKQWADEFGTIALQVMSAVLVIAAAGRILSGFAGVLWAVGRAFAGFRIVAMAITGLGPTIGIIRGIAAAFGAVRAAFAAGGIVAGISSVVSLLGGPIVVGIAAVIAIVAGLWLAWENNFLGIRDITASVVAFIGDAWDWIVQVFTNVWAFLEPIFAAIIAPFVKLAQEGIPALVSRLQELWTNIQPIFQSIGEVADEVWNGIIIPAWEKLMEVIGVFVNEVFPKVVELVGTWVGLAQQLVELFFKVLETWWNWFIEVIGTAVGAVVGFVIWMFETIMGVAGPAIEWLIRWWGFLFETIVNIISVALDIVADIFGAAFDFLMDIFGAFEKLFSGDILGFVGDIIGAFANLAANVIDIIIEWTFKILGFFKDMFLNIVTKFPGFVGEVLGFLGGLVSKLPGLGADIVRGLWDGIWGLVGWIGEKVGKFLGDVWDNFLGFFGIGKKAGGKSEAAKLGENLVKGIWDGITGMAQWLIDKVMGWAGDIIDGVLEFFGIQSPSTVFAEMGTNLVLGLAKGITGEDSALMAMENLNKKLAAEATGGFGALFETPESTFSATYDNQRVIRVEVDLTSSDGSVEDLTLDQLQAAVDGGLVAAVERMAEIVD